MCAILMIWVCWDCIWGLVAHGNSTIGGRTAFPVFRACGGLVLLHWFWGFSTYTWTRYRINYIFLFDFNPNIVDSPLAIFNDAVDETLVFPSSEDGVVTQWTEVWSGDSVEDVLSTFNG